MMVLGHEKCGAVKATVEAVEKNAHAEADIDWLVEDVRPAVENQRVRRAMRLTLPSRPISN